MNLREAAQQALEALEKLVVGSEYEDAIEAERAITALRAALAEPVQEPDTDCHAQGICQRSGYSLQPHRKPLTEGKPWVCACGANLYIDENGAPRSKA